jgi:hypothetical protein
VFENLFNKNNNLDSTPAANPESAAAAAQTDSAAAGISAEETAAWQARISAAASDDAALLQLAQQAPTVPLKLAAIEALTLEASFKQAMHDFREQDKRLYRAAKSRYETAHGKRVATEEAHTLIAAARTLFQQELVPVNRVVELDRAWSALNVDLLDAELRAEFTALSEQLAAKVRATSERAQSITRWLGVVDNAMAALQSTLPGVAQGDVPPTDTEAPAVTLLELVHGTPDATDTRCIDKADAGKRLLALASSVVERAKFLQALPALQAADEADEKARIEQWREFPEISDGELHTVLAHRFADWRNASSGERQREHEALSAQERAQRAEKNKQRTDAVQRDIEAAEAAQAAGHVADLTKLLGQIDHALKRGPVNASLTQRIDALRREQRRLHEWQRWSGGQGREKLAAEAQALAEQASGKVAIKAHADAIEKLRERWKEIDKLGGASNQTVWLAFDGALKAAYVPVAAHLDKLKVARQENLTAREKIVTDLQAAAVKFFPAAQEGTATTTPDWRALSHTLDEAQVAWRKLGPVEHTVPRKALQGDKSLTTRYAAAVQALEAPLKGAYSEARTQRETLVAAAKTLAASDVSARDTVDKVRKLQTQWQAVAKAQPLPRRDENALWGAFKTATDAIFTARDAARAASEAEFTEKLKAREAIVDSLGALRQATTAADVKRALTEADTAWRAAPDVPKAHAAKLDARYRAARDAASQRIGEITAHAAQARYDALITKMALCDEREKLLDAPDSNGTLSEEQASDLEARWNAVTQFPDTWKPKLDARFAGVMVGSASPAAKSSKDAKSTLPDVLLNLEVACSIESPADFAAARQHLKILALKNAMEGRQTTATTPADIERWLLDAAAWARPDETSRARLAKIIAAVRVRRPG